MARRAGPRSPSPASPGGSTGARDLKASPALARSPAPAVPVLEPPTWLHVSGLTRNVRAAHVAEIFGTFGAVSAVDLAIDRSVGLPRGFASVAFERREEADKALEAMDGAQIDGARIAVRPIDACDDDGRQRGGRDESPRRRSPRDDDGWQRSRRDDDGWQRGGRDESPRRRSPRGRSPRGRSPRGGRGGWEDGRRREAHGRGLGDEGPSYGRDAAPCGPSYGRPRGTDVDRMREFEREYVQAERERRRGGHGGGGEGRGGRGGAYRDDRTPSCSRSRSRSRSCSWSRSPRGRPASRSPSQSPSRSPSRSSARAPARSASRSRSSSRSPSRSASRSSSRSPPRRTDRRRARSSSSSRSPPRRRARREGSLGDEQAGERDRGRPAWR